MRQKSNKKNCFAWKTGIFLPVFSLFIFDGAFSIASDNQIDAEVRKEREPGLNEQVLNCMTSSGYHSYPEEYVCPIGGEIFKSIILGTHSTYGRNLDLEPISYIDFPAPLPVCPSNGFVIAEPDYSEDKLERIREVIESNDYKALFSEKHATYYLYAELNKQLAEEGTSRWWHLLNATWEADNCGAADRYQRYALETIDAAKVHLDTIDKSEPLYWVLNIVISNLYRRTGDFASARSWLDGFDDQSAESSTDESTTNDNYKLALALLRKAIADENEEQVPIKE